MTEESLFELALRTPEAERAALLDRECVDQPELRARVEALLKADVASSPLLKPPQSLDITTGFQPTQQFTSSDPTPGNIIAGRYTLEQKLGEGGMGEVWVAKQSEPIKRRVALKLIKAGMDSKSVVQRFEQERQALAVMDHPNIAKVLDGGIDSCPLTPGPSPARGEGRSTGRPFFVMELVNGFPLTKFCDDAKLGIKERLELFVPICHAVQHAHQKGIIHRDLKPGNILVTLIDGKPVPKVIDFGVAKATSGRLTDESLSTQFGTVVGTLEYMAPEQAGYSGEDIDTQADIYSLGVILYEMLTGLRPFDSKRLKKAALDEMIRIIREEEPSKPSTRLSTDDSLPSVAAIRHIEPKKLTALLRGELDWVVMKCLEKQRNRRYETANGVARDIQRYLANEPVEARPPSTGYRLQKFITRNKGQVIAAGLVLAALLAGIVGTSWGMFEARQYAIAERDARHDAQEQAQLAVQAADKERTANQLAQTRLVQVEKGNELLLSVFTDLDHRTEEKEGKPLRAILGDRIDRVVGQLKEDSVGDPLAVARLQARLGAAQLNLSQFTRAITLYSTALQTLKEKLGADHPDTLVLRCQLADAYRLDNQPAQSLAIEEETLKLRLVKLGPIHPDTLFSRNILAEAYRAMGRTEQAIQMHEEILKARTEKLGPDDRETLVSRGNLANVYLAAERIAEAIAMHEGTLKLSIAKHGPDHIDTLVYRLNLGGAYRNAGRLSEAIAMNEETLKLCIAKLGPDHQITVISRINLASAYRHAGRFVESIALNEETVKISTAKFGATNPETLTSRNNLAESYRLAGQLDKAIPLLEATLQARQSKLGQHHPDTLQSQSNLALAYETVKRFEPAESLRREVMAQRRKSGKPGVPLARDLFMLSRVLLELKKWSEAEALLNESKTILAKAQPNDWEYFNVVSLLGGAIMGQGRQVEAEPLLLAGYQGLAERAAKIPRIAPPFLAEALERLIQYYTVTNKPDEVKKWQEKRIPKGA